MFFFRVFFITVLLKCYTFSLLQQLFISFGSCVYFVLCVCCRVVCCVCACVCVCVCVCGVVLCSVV